MSIKLPIVFIFFFLSISSIIAQKIQVFEKESHAPISGVAIFNNDKTISGISDLDGFVDISDFSENEKITFQHISHTSSTISKEQILESNYKVYLEVDTSTLDEVILSVSKFKQNKKDIPQKIVSVTSEDIQFTNPQTSADLLESSGNVFVQKASWVAEVLLLEGFQLIGC